jgi:hypothetical protein
MVPLTTLKRVRAELSSPRPFCSAEPEAIRSFVEVLIRMSRCRAGLLGKSARLTLAIEVSGGAHSAMTLALEDLD